MGPIQNPPAEALPKGGASLSGVAACLILEISDALLSPPPMCGRYTATAVQAVLEGPVEWQAVRSGPEAGKDSITCHNQRHPMERCPCS